MCEPTEFHKKRITVKFITSIGITREILRHRVFSFMNESTRWCNYSKGKFGSELTFVIPQWIYDCRNEHASYIDPLTRVSRSWLIKLTGEELIDSLCTIDRTVSSYCDVLEKIEAEYNFDVVEPDGYKLKPEEARGMLPMDTKSELVMTGFIDDWIGFFLQRSYFSTTGRPHPDIQKLADLLMLDFLDRGFITNAQINRIKDEVYKKQVFEESS
jgi:thymidylate synthase (FAD)